MVFAIAINYGARDEMRRGMIRMAEDVKAEKLEPTAITEQTIGSYLDTADMPDPDLLIRTSGVDQNQRRTETVELFALAAGLHRNLCDRCFVA